MKKAYPIYIFLVVLTGCAVGPNYKRPEVSLPANYRGATVPAGTNSLADLAFWEVFRDPTLQSLVRTALTNNYDLRIAISRVEQARAVLVQNRGLFFPQLNYGAGVSRGRNASGGQAVFEGGATVDSFSFAGNASWELDLWGPIRRLNESARAELLANEEARHGVMVTLVSDVATTYFQ